MTEQLSFFSGLGDTAFRIGDEVKLMPISEEQDELSHNYFKYYYPHCINKIGKIVAMQGSSLTLSIQGEQIMVNKREVILIR